MPIIPIILAATAIGSGTYGAARYALDIRVIALG